MPSSNALPSVGEFSARAGLAAPRTMERFEISSFVSASPQEAWQWITSVKGISTELSPYLRMSAPKGISALHDLKHEPGKPMFRSIIYLFGLLPVDYSDLTLLELNSGVGFIEQSPMGSMRHWRHERTIHPAEQGCTITDVLSFEPRLASKLCRGIIQWLFTHRHRVLRCRLRRPGQSA